jgi:hypothetical protein
MWRGRWRIVVGREAARGQISGQPCDHDPSPSKERSRTRSRCGSTCYLVLSSPGGGAFGLTLFGGCQPSFDGPFWKNLASLL